MSTCLSSHFSSACYLAQPLGLPPTRVVAWSSVYIPAARAALLSAERFEQDADMDHRTFLRTSIPCRAPVLKGDRLRMEHQTAVTVAFGSRLSSSRAIVCRPLLKRAARAKASSAAWESLT